MDAVVSDSSRDIPHGFDTNHKLFIRKCLVTPITTLSQTLLQSQSVRIDPSAKRSKSDTFASNLRISQSPVKWYVL